MFQGFYPDTQNFLWGIALNNNREWFMSQKEVYVQKVYTPLKALAYDVQDLMTEACPDLDFNCKVTRIYRDARIPYPDGPYKKHLWFMLAPPTDPDLPKVNPGLFFEIEGSGYSMGVDFYCSRPAVMELFRQKVLEKPFIIEEFTLRLQECPEFVIEGPEYKRSKGDVGPLVRPWFNRKRLCILGTYDWGSELYTPDLTTRVADTFQWLMPIYRFLLDIE